MVINQSIGISKILTAAKFYIQCYRPQTWQLYLFFPVLSISAIHKVPGITFKGE